MAKKIAFMTNKGGTGKTTVTTNIASALHIKEPNKRILIIDMDGQGNSSTAFNLVPDKIENTIYDCMTDDLPPENVIIKLKNAYKEPPLSLQDNLHLLPANDDMNWWELDTLPDLHGRDPFGFLKKVTDQLEDKYDYIFIDSPPEMKVIAGNILKVVDSVFVPYKPETFSVQGMIKVLLKIKDSRKKFGGQATLGGIIAMMIEKQTKLHSDLLLQADAYCKKNNIPFLKTRIPKSIRYADAQRYGMPEVLADPNGAYGQLYFELLEEVLSHNG